MEGELKFPGLEVYQNYKRWFDQVRLNDKDEFDRKAGILHVEAEEKIDCLECAQCCRTTVTTFTEKDVQRIAPHLGLKPKAFISKYLIKDYDGMLTTTGIPCSFLDLETNKCKIYEIRPEACSSFPHTDKSKFFLRRKAHLANSRFCGITRYVLDGLMKEFD